MTQTHPGRPEELRGTYAGLAHPAIIEHLTSLGVTAIELMPVHQFMHDHRLLDLGLRNYWGYNTFGFFAPHYEYAATGTPAAAVAEFKSMVRALPRGRHRGDPRRGLQPHRRGQPPRPDAQLPRHRQRRVLPPGRRRPAATTGLHRHRQQPNVRHPHTLQLIMDSLRYWVTEMHVDGFRFDLASTLAREFHDVDRLSRVLRPGAAGPGGQPGQADRRAVGRRRGRLPGRQLPASVDRVERQVPRHRPRLLAGRAGDPGRVRLPAHRVVGPVRRRPAGGRRASINFVTAPRRLHAAPTWCPTTKSTTRPTARTTATARATTGRGTAASRGRPTTRDPRAARPAAAQLPATLMLSPGHRR